MTTPLDFPCPTCRAQAGVKCTDYRGRNCAPHRGRGGALSFAAAARARNKAQAEAHARAQAEAPLFGALDPPPAEVTAQDEYLRHQRIRARTAEGMVTADARGVFTTDATRLLRTLKTCCLRQLAARALPAEVYAQLTAAAAALPEDHRPGVWMRALTGERQRVALRVTGQRQTPHGTFNNVEEVYWPPQGWQAPHTRQSIDALFAWENDPPAEVPDGGLAAALDALPLWRNER